MIEGLSTNRRCESSAACLFDAGKRFVFRYHSRETTQPEKRLHPREAAELARAGIDIATIYQDRARQVADFGAARGEQDGISALLFAGQAGQPPGSAVYFAVDSDFSSAEVTSAVVPYFNAVQRVFAEAGKGTPYLTIGVYGSGLTCRLVGQLPFVAHRWLAESTGWRESKTFDGWQVKQHLNTGQALCALGTAFERCESRGDFGAFKPVGFAFTAGQGEPRRIKAEGGNIRHLPSTAFNTPIALLPQGHELRVLGISAPGWVRVRTQLGGGELIGHVAESRLELVLIPADPPLPAAPPLPRAMLAENNPAAARASTGGYPFPLGEPGRPTRSAAATPEAKRAQLRAIGDWLAVESSARWRPRVDGTTFCNVYAADYCYLAGVYLPRVWWTDAALVLIGQGQTPPALYAQTVREMRADDLFAWLVDCGPSFGWKRVFDASALQACADGGGVGVICADREAEGRAGHISVVLPEDDAHAAQRDADGHVTQPLQSQAGMHNFRYGSAGADWWRSAQFRDRGFFVHM